MNSKNYNYEIPVEEEEQIRFINEIDVEEDAYKKFIKQLNKESFTKIPGDYTDNPEGLYNNLNVSALGISENMINEYIKKNPEKFVVKNNMPGEIRDLGDLELGIMTEENIISNIRNDAPLKKL